MVRKYANYLMLILFGTIMAVGVFVKIIFSINIDSDWFWFLAGIGIMVEGFISLSKQKKFDRKYKIIER